MQVSIKRQLKIELDQADIVEAVGLFLKANNVSVLAQDLEDMVFVKSPKDGLRATLNVTEESVSEDEPQTVISTSGATVSTTELEPVKAEEASIEPEPQEAPGEVETSTVEDVTAQAVDAAVDEVIERAFTPDPVEESEDDAVEAEPEAPSVAARNSLFN